MSERSHPETAKRANETAKKPPGGFQTGLFDIEKPKNGKLPAIQFYPGDWKKSPDVQACSLAARGLWIEMLFIMHESTPRGFLELNGQPMTDAQLARLVSASVDEIALPLKELESAGVFSKDDRGVIFCRRFSREEQIRKIRSEAGKLGAIYGKDGGRPRKVENDQNGKKGKITPSSSSSSSSDLKTPPTPKGGGGAIFDSEAKTKKPRRKKNYSTPEHPFFAEFWKVYPRKENREKANEAFAAIDPAPELFREILAAIDWQKLKGSLVANFTNDGRSTIPHPATWLNNKRWTDEPPRSAAEARCRPSEIPGVNTPSSAPYSPPPKQS